MGQWLAQPPSQQQGGQCNQQCAHKTRVQQRHRPHVAGRHGREAQHGGGLQQQAKQARHPAGLAHAHPERARTFKRPDGGRPLRVQRQGHGQCGKTHTHGGETFDQQPVSGLAPARQPQRQQQVERTQSQRRESTAQRQVLHQPHLQAKSHQRGAEHQGGIHRIAQLRRCVAGIEDGRRHIDQHKGDEEGLGAGKLATVVLEHAPGGGHTKGGHKTQQVQHAPRTLESDEQDGEIEHQVVAEQPHMAALPGGQQHRHRKTTRKRRHGECARVLQQRQRTTECTHHHHQHKSQQRRHQAVQAERGKHGEVHHRHTTPLQRQRETGFGQSFAKTHGQQRNTCRTNGRKPQLHREQARHRRIPRQERQANEQNYQPDAHDGVAAQQPVARGTCGLHGNGRWAGGGWRCRGPHGCRGHSRIRCALRRAGRNGDVWWHVRHVQVQINRTVHLLGGREIGLRPGWRGDHHRGGLRHQRSGPCHFAAYGFAQRQPRNRSQHRTHHSARFIPARQKQTQNCTPHHAP